MLIGRKTARVPLAPCYALLLVGLFSAVAFAAPPVGGQPVSKWQAQLQEANRLAEANEYAQAEPFYRLAVKEAETVGGQGSEMATCLRQLGVNLRDQGQYPEAEAVLKKALAIRTKASGDDALEIADLHDDIGRVYLDQGRYSQSRAPFAKAL